MKFNNVIFWSGYFKEVFIPQISAVVSLLEARLLPSFDGIEEEAQEASKAEWSRLMSRSGPEDADMGALADQAYDVGIAHYEMMSGLRQGLQNMFAVALHHLFEQQIFVLLRREILDPSEDDNANLISTSVFRKRIRESGVDIEKFRSWPLIKELRFVANTVKHTEGDSASKLFETRPDLYSPSNTVLNILPWPHTSAHVFSPLMGDDIYISTEQLKIYAEAIIDFWNEMSETMASA